MNNRWTYSNTTVFNVAYYLIWCPKYRQKVLVGDIQKRLEELLIEKASKIRCKIEALEIMPDHVHLFVKTVPTLSPHFVVQQLKRIYKQNIEERIFEVEVKTTYLVDKVLLL